MATAQYDNRTRTVEETVVVLTLTEHEAEALKDELILIHGSEVVRQVLGALRRPTAKQSAPTADTFEYDGVTYELGATYRDTEGDRFTFERGTKSDGTPPGRLHYADGSHGDTNWSLGEVVHNYGPLTKVLA
ncbi:phiSA1p31-related protein [Streptomyces sp. or20]|uniref:phiSA1p31-related protein n=1 Tax=Streptomyces sp. or20 TaxID=1828016 RepID=UPI000BF0D599|nr:phiSA1p31-related protein [Streptomyces sp. or20]